MAYKLAIFDLDGTILDTLEDLADATNYALGEHGYPGRTIEEVRRFVGNGIRKLIERAVPDGLTEEEIDRVHQTFSAYYEQHCADKTRPYEGILQLLENLRGQAVSRQWSLTRQTRLYSLCANIIIKVCLTTLWASGQVFVASPPRILYRMCYIVWG